MIVEDFVMLGKTVPEQTADGRRTVCSAGWSRELGQLLRIYPLAMHAAPPRWSVSRVPLARNPKDNRSESWRIAADTRITHHRAVNGEFDIHGKLAPTARVDLFDQSGLWEPSIAAANEHRRSLCLLRPVGAPTVTYEHNPTSPDSPQLALFDSGLDPVPFGAKRFPFIPRLEFADDAGRHALMIRDWGCYERMRKAPDAFDLADALHIGPSSALLVGNFNRHRTSWLVISVLNEDRQQFLLGAAS